MVLPCKDCVGQGEGDPEGEISGILEIVDGVIVLAAFTIDVKMCIACMHRIIIITEKSAGPCFCCHMRERVIEYTENSGI